MDTARLQQLMRDTIDARRVYDDAKVAKTKAYEAKQRLEGQLHDALVDTKQSSLVVDLGPGYGRRRFVKWSTDYAVILDRERAMASLEARGYERAAIVGEKIREQPANELVRELLENHQEFPDGLDFRTTKGVRISSK